MEKDQKEKEKPLTEKISNFFTSFNEELDAFTDDAINRRFGNGAKFYGMRKSNMYGSDDPMRKRNRN